jgi:predicted CXXCH cytochrome family protein
MTERRIRSEPGLDVEAFRHDRSVYERPNARVRCGRASLWAKPCPRGPNADGSCGGVADCQPTRGKTGRFECRRPKHLGGPCATGPGPDGACAHRRPPCVPQPTLRTMRGRLALVAFCAVLALVIAFSGAVRIGSAGINSVEPGPLFGPHAGFAPKGACSTCHDAHGGDLSTLAAAFVEPTDMTEACTSCHTFAGDARKAHNTSFADRPDLDDVACNQCHLDHQGADADLTAIDDRICATCHTAPFTTFEPGHPAFGAGYPHRREASIKFDHASHINKHFSDAKVAERAPTSCAACHDVTTATNAVLPVKAAETCDGCHGSQITQRDIVVFRLPELATSEIDAEAVREVCGPTLADFERLEERMAAVEAGETMADEDAEDEEFESVSLDEMAPLASYVLDVDVDDMDAYGQPVQDLVMAMAEEGSAPLASALEDRLGVPATSLLAGLNPELVKRVACAWAANVEYEPPADPDNGGWFGDYLELKYRPMGHADPVLRAWIETSLAAPDEDERTAMLRETMLDPKEGPGACIKCHAVHDAAVDAEGPALMVEWTYHAEGQRAYYFYSHRAHLSLVHPTDVAMSTEQAGCQTCHGLDAAADFAASFNDTDPMTFASNFEDIRIETCAECHAEREVRADCRLCHRYHLEATFKPDMMGAFSQE